MGDKLSMSQQRPYGQEGQGCPGVHWEECGQQVKGDDPVPLLSPGGATSGMLCPVLGSQHKKQKEIGEGPMEATKTTWGLEHLL